MGRTRTIFTGAMAAVAVAAGAAGAVAATGGRDGEGEVLAGAAERLGVTANELRDALSAARDEQLDAAVKAGELTQEQADAIKAHRRDGHTRGFGRGGPGFGFAGPGFVGGPGAVIDDAAEALGLTREKLFEQLRAGKPPAQIAATQGKDLEDVKAAVKAAVTKRLDAAVSGGDITKAQRDEMLEHLEDHIDRLADGHGPDFGRGHHGPPPGFLHP